MKLIIINYSMRSDSTVFSHQRDTAIALLSVFTEIDVVTTEVSDDVLPKGLQTHLVVWKPSNRLRNSMALVKKVFPILIRDRSAIVFSHMTDVHAALISPITWALRMRHVLWYAHTTTSVFLLWSSFFVSEIATSTKGSCRLPINTRKIRSINQGVHSELFLRENCTSKDFKRFFYYGRLDESKNIHKLVDLGVSLRTSGSLEAFDIYGKALKPESVAYLEKLKSRVSESTLASIISFHGPIERAKIQNIVSNYDVFVNLFSGSLDKTLIEMTMMSIPVVTWNEEYCTQFGTWSGNPVRISLDFIQSEISFLQNSTLTIVQAEIARRLRIAMNQHEFVGWIKRLSSILQSKEIR